MAGIKGQDPIQAPPSVFGAWQKLLGENAQLLQDVVGWCSRADGRPRHDRDHLHAARGADNSVARQICYAGAHPDRQGAREHERRRASHERGGGEVRLARNREQPLLKDKDHYGNYRSWTFDANGNTDSARDERGSTTTFVNDAMGRVKEEHAPITGIVAYWNWNGAGLLTSMTDAEGRVSTNDYDSRGLLAKSVQGYGSATPATELFNYDAAAQLTGTRSATGWWSYLGYDADGRQDSATDEKGFVSRTLYDLAGQAVQAKDNLGNLTTWAYAVRGWVDSATDAGGTTVYGHNASGDVTSATDPASHTTSFDIDKLHRTTKVTDPLTFTVRTDFTAAGDTDTVTDQRSIVTKEYFDPLHRLASETQAFGTAAARTETDQYDEDGDLAKSWDWAGKLTSYAYDTMDRLASATDPLLHTVSQALDKVGEVLASTDALLKATGFAWNALGQNTASTDPDGHADGEQHDPEGHVVLTTDGAGDPSWRAYDERGQLVLETDARGGTTKRSYDADGHLSVLVDPAGNTWTWQYDHLDREVKRTDPYGNSVLTAYNTAGLVASVTDRDGRSKTYAYDADDRETSEAWKDAGGTTVDTLGFAYDQAGNLLTAANSQGTYTRTYDAFGRVTAQTGLYGVGYTFTYDVRGYRTGVTDTLGGTTASTYDDAGRLVTRTFTDGTTSLREDLGYDARDERTNESRYADLAGTVLAGTTVRGYDDAGNLTGLQYKDGSGATISDYANVFDAADRIASETRNGGTPTTYSYDTTSQLTSDSSKSYSYDLAGNRTMAGYATGASNRITSDGTWSFSYDAEGNVVKRSKGASAETWTYGFDNNNRMLWAEDRATDGGTLIQRIDMAYDAFGQRVKESVTVPGSGTTVREYAFADDGQVQAELASTNALVTRYIRGDAQGELWARVGATGGAAWLLQDRLGSLRDVASASGAAIDHIDYDAFGNVTAASAPSLTGDFTYTGLWRQRETETFHAFWRDYGASWGGWMQDDPSHIEGGGDPNVRRYAGNNPANETDLSGLITPSKKRENYLSEIRTPKKGILGLGVIDWDNPVLPADIKHYYDDFTFELKRVGKGSELTIKYHFFWGQKVDLEPLQEALDSGYAKLGLGGWQVAMDTAQKFVGKNLQTYKKGLIDTTIDLGKPVDKLTNADLLAKLEFKHWTNEVKRLEALKTPSEEERQALGAAKIRLQVYTRVYDLLKDK